MRLIDADALINTLNKEKIEFNEDINYFILYAPTIDAVPIIRCKNCEYYNGEDKYCVNDIFAKSNGYCMYGRGKR